MRINPIDSGRRRSVRRRALTMGMLALGIVACNTETLVDLRNPDLITGGVARDPANIEQLFNGVLFEFGRAVSGAAATNDNPGAPVDILVHQLNWRRSDAPSPSATSR